MSSPAQQPTPAGPEKKRSVPIKKAKAKMDGGNQPEEGKEVANGHEDEEVNGKANTNADQAQLKGDASHRKRENDKAEQDEELDPSYQRHPRMGAYIRHRGLSICTSLGEGVMFFGLDCR